MSPADLKNWRKSMKLTQAQAADSLGISRRAYQAREAGEAEITRETELACRYLTEHMGTE